MFGFLKRRRHRDPTPGDTSPPAKPDPAPAKSDDERTGKSWYSSSLDLHDGLDVSDVEDVQTTPMPLDPRNR